MNEPSLRAKRVKRVTCARCELSVDVEHVDPFTNVTCPGCEKSLPVPAELNQFHLYRVLGQGSMGSVYHAVDRRLRRQVAVKVLRTNRHNGAQQAARCIAEARALAALNHPNVVQIYTVDQNDEDQPFIVMELVNGGCLESIIRDEGPVDEARALQMAIDVAKGLQAAAGVSLIHGDVKPANILLDQAGVAKLVDFGIARAADDDEAMAEARGTPRYVAPEIVLKQMADHRADQFSLGATLYHALCGRFPFDGPTVVDVLRARLEHEAQDLREVKTDLHAETAAVVSRMLRIDPGSRFADYEELLTALYEALQATLDGPAQPNLVELDDARRSARRVRRRRKFNTKSAKRPVMVLLLISLALGGWIGHTLWWNATQRKTLRLSEHPGDPPRWISLFGLVEAGRDGVTGPWEKRGEGLRLSTTGSGSLSIPFLVEGSYEARVKFRLLDGDGGVCVFLPVGDRLVLLTIEHGGAVGRLKWVDGKELSGPGVAPVTDRSDQAGRTQQHCAVDITVVIDGDQAAITASVQDQELVRWSGGLGSLSVEAPWDGVRNHYLGLGGWENEILFEGAEIRVLPDPDAGATAGVVRVSDR